MGKAQGPVTRVSLVLICRKCVDTAFLTELIVNSFEGDQSMLDGKRYYAVFPDEDPAIRKPVLRNSPTLIAALRELEKQLRTIIPTVKADG